jgi:signal transduction histidine kinase
MDSSSWPTQQLAEFIAGVSTAGTETAAARVAAERAAEALDADVAAIMCGGEPVAAVGYLEGSVPAGDLGRVRPGAAGSWLDVPGVGRCAAAAAALEYPPGATLVLARPCALTSQETSLLRGMARVTAMTMRMLSILGAERAARGEIERLADEQAALRRVATLVARGAAPGEVFAAVAQEVGHVLPAADFTMVGRYGADRVVEVVGGWSRAGSHELVGRRSKLGGRNVSTLVFERGEPARANLRTGADEAVIVAAREIGVRSAAGAPISVEGRLWGVMIVSSTRDSALPGGTEYRLAAFTELIATTIANAQARVELHAIADEQAALRRVATLVARGAAPGEVFAAVAREVARLLPADMTVISRYEDGMVSEVAGWSSIGESLSIRESIRERVSLGGRNVTEIVFETGRPARMDSYADASGAIAANALSRGISSSVGVPINVEGQVWGVMVAAVTRGQRLPPDTEERLADFTELVATALANAEAREELRRVADEQAALRRVATLVARGTSASALFRTVTTEIGLLLPADATVLSRYDADGCLTRVGRWSRPGVSLPPGERSPLGGRNVSTLVFETGQAVRLDSYGDDAGDAAVWVAAGLRSSVGVPINVDGRLWGVVVAASMSGEPLPADTEARLAGFTELVATAIANAEAQAELTASRARIVATADETRRRIERDLHDGAQQRLISLALQIRAAQAAVSSEPGKLRAELDRVAAGLTSTLDELREYARGIHPAIVADGGLAPALKTLARRSSIPVTLDVRAHERLAERVEVTAYYVVSEALANAAKHARASAIEVCASVDGKVLRLLVRDDGVGGADPARGSGLVGLKDRVAAIGGTLNMRSHPGDGTTLLVELPVSPLRLSAG